MKRLLAIVEEKTAQKTLDITLRFTLSALWNLTGKIGNFQNGYTTQCKMKLKLLNACDFHEEDCPLLHAKFQCYFCLL